MYLFIHLIINKRSQLWYFAYTLAHYIVCCTHPLVLALYPLFSFTKSVGTSRHCTRASSHLAAHVITSCFSRLPIGSLASQSGPFPEWGAHPSTLCHHYNLDVVTLLMRMEERLHNYINGLISLSPGAFTPLRPLWIMMNLDRTVDDDLWVGRCSDKNVLLNNTYCNAV